MPLGKIYKILWYNLLKDVYKDYYENYEKRFGCFSKGFAGDFLFVLVNMMFVLVNML